MTLQLVLSHPAAGRWAPPVVDGELSYELDRYPRAGLSVRTRPEPGRPGLLDSPYGTVATVLDPSGARVFTGPVMDTSTRRPDGGWQIDALDPIAHLSNARFSETPRTLPGGPVDVAGWALLIAQTLQVDTLVAVTGGGGTVNPSGIDVAGRDGWRLVEDQLIANSLDVDVQGDGTLHVVPAPAMKTLPDHRLRVGETGTITAWDVQMRGLANRIVITHRARKPGEDDRWIDGVWTDTGPISGIGAPGIGPRTLTKTVDVGEDWWADPAGHQAQADAAAATAAQLLRGHARTWTIDAIPDYRIRPGDTLEAVLGGGTGDLMLITGTTWPLGPGPMRITGRNPEPDAAAARLLKLEV